MRSIILATGMLLLGVVPAVSAPDETPYKEDGPKRDWFLQSFIRVCEQEPRWLKISANQKETIEFCTCKALFTADIWTIEDDLEYERSKLGYIKLPAATFDKWIQSTLACQKHFSKLPKVPSRSKTDMSGNGGH
jgi:hypothetical protein